MTVPAVHAPESPRDRYTRLAAEIVERERAKFAPEEPASLADTFRDAIREGVISAGEFTSLTLPERETFLSPWLRAATVSMIYGPRGVGKTWFTLALCTAVTRSLPLGPWEPEQPVNCLLVDGEMSLHDLQDRLRRMEANLPDSPARLSILSSDRQHDRSLPLPCLTNPGFRDGLTAFLEERPDLRLVIFDNLASMSGGTDENAKQEWDAVNSWLLSLRFMGRAVILIHHSGKSGDQRGTSGREDNLDCVLRLSRPHGHQASDGAVFDVEFTKCRGVVGDGLAPFQLAITQVDGKVTWATEAPKQNIRNTIVALLASGVQQKEIAGVMQCSRMWITKVKQQAIEEGMLAVGDKNKIIGFTEKGKSLLGDIEVDRYLR